MRGGEETRAPLLGLARTIRLAGLGAPSGMAI